MILQGTTPTLTIMVNAEELLLADVTEIELTFQSGTTVANVSAFLNTPLRGRNGLTAKVYVPEALIDDYKAASVWTTLNGYGYIEWLPIEGSEYEL